MAIRFIVAGTGWVAGEYLKAIHAHPDAEVYGVFSRNTDYAKARLSELGIGARIYSDYTEAVKDPQADAVVLCSTPDVRVEQAVLAAQYGKHLVIEKPMALDRAGLWRMAEAIGRQGIRTVASFVLRWNPSINNTKALIDDDAIGRIFMAQLDYWHHVGPQYGQYRWSSKRELGGSSMLSAGCHAVDALRYFAGEITEVTAYGCRTWDHTDYEFDPNVIALLKLKNGGIGKVSSSLECKTTYKFNVHLLGEKGTILNNQLFSHKLPGQTEYAGIPTILPDNGDVAQQTFAEEIHEFILAILHKTKTRCDFFDAFHTMEACFAIDESIATGQKVSLPLAQ